MGKVNKMIVSCFPLNRAPKYITITITVAVFAQSVFKIDNRFTIKCDSQIVYTTACCDQIMSEWILFALLLLF